MDKTETTQETVTETPETKSLTAKEVHAAITDREKRLLANIDKKLAEVAASVPKAEAPAEEKKAKTNDEWRKEMENRVIAAEKVANAERQAREEERKTRLVEEERNSLANALRGKGVDEKRLKGAMALLYTEEKKVTRDETGAIKFRVQREGYEDLMDLGAAVEEWLKTEEGKTYLPPRPAAGSGSGVVTRGQGQPKNSREELQQAIANSLFNKRF